jgi:AcrR family transcriptional regulator
VHSLAATDLAARAGLPEVALAVHYGTIDNCLVATYDEVSQKLYRIQLEAFAGPGDWHTRCSRAVAAALGHIESTPGAARLCFGELARGNPRIRVRRAAARQRVVRLLADEYERERREGLPDLHFEFLVGALFRAAQDELAAGRAPTRVAERVKELLAVLEPVAA